MFKVSIIDYVCEKELTTAELKPCQLAVIVDAESPHLGDIVMRTSSADKFEVMSLGNAKKNHYWHKEHSVKVKLLPKGTKITLEVV